MVAHQVPQKGGVQVLARIVTPGPGLTHVRPLGIGAHVQATHVLPLLVVDRVAVLRAAPKPSQEDIAAGGVGAT